MGLGGDMGLSMGTTINEIACAANEWKPDSASQTLHSRPFSSSSSNNSSSSSSAQLATRYLLLRVEEFYGGGQHSVMRRAPLSSELREG
ncbi:hypothetical protein E2C01_025064 [Portunus trituberculatus]|uniref:Uncharacterized protein n=1 Tax=Portunus trituberculatus TaxID=210409 RepID=A0A5B7EEI5_PORTR|nr:hypothetical protein [Portunus trituberculatus]